MYSTMYIISFTAGIVSSMVRRLYNDIKADMTICMKESTVAQSKPGGGIKACHKFTLLCFLINVQEKFSFLSNDSCQILHLTNIFTLG